MYLSGETSIFGIIGEPIQHSFSPAMQTVAFQKCNYNAVYLPFAVKKEKLFQVIPALETLNVSGINVTAPYKTEIIPYLTEISEEAKILQSVNTIYRKNEAWVGCSTDGAGFIKGLTEIDISPTGKSIQIIGAGGASQSIIYNLAKQGAQKIYISNRTYSKVLQTIQNYSRLFPNVEFVGGNCEQNIDLLVNTTSIGTDGSSMSVPLELIQKSKVVVDIIYHLETPLLKKAKQLEKITLGGLPMLLYQGALSFEIWTKQEAPIEVMRQCLQELIAE